MPDPLATSASIIGILQLITNVITYLNDVKNAPKEATQLALESSNLYGLLTQLRYRLDEADSKNDPRYTSVRTLGIENGPLDQYKTALEAIQSKLKKKKLVVGFSGL